MAEMAAVKRCNGMFRLLVSILFDCIQHNLIAIHKYFTMWLIGIDLYYLYDLYDLSIYLEPEVRYNLRCKNEKSLNKDNERVLP